MRDPALFAAPTGLQTIVHAWREWRGKLKTRSERRELGNEAAAIARDLNLSGPEFVRQAALPPGSAALLDERLQSLGLARASIEKDQPAVMADLQRVCSSCSLKARCARDLSSERSVEKVAEYCPNEQTLKSFRKA